MTTHNDNYSAQTLAALKLGQIADAETLFNQALSADDDELIYNLAEELYALGFLAEAQRAYQQLLAKYPHEDQLKTALADIAIEEDDLDLAQEYLASIGPESDSYLQALLVKADLYQSEGLVESAEHALRQAQEVAPDEKIVRFALAEFYSATGQYRQAIGYYRNLLLEGARYISQVDIVSRIAMAYAAIGNYDNAIGYLEQIKPAMMSLDTKFQLAMLYYQSQRDDEAIELFEEILASDDQYTSIYPWLGQAYEHQYQLEKAYQNYQLGLSLDQTNPLLYRLAGQAAEKLGDDNQAQSYYRKALELDDQDVVNYLVLADLKLAQHQYQDVVDLITGAEDNELFDPKFYWDLARAYHALEDEDQAEKNWQSALKEYKDQADFLRDLADWYHEMGRSQLEKQTLERYLVLEPDDIDIQGRLAELLLDD